MKTYKLNGEITDFEFHNDFWDFCSPKGLCKFLDGLTAGEKAVIEINSPGGLVVQGVEMANAIKNSKAHLIAHVTGIAASMASVIACACDEIEMEEASFMMIHDPWGYASGNAAELRKEAKLLDQMKEVIMSFYRGKFDRTDEELAALMSEETWYTGAECKENGLKCTVVKSDVAIAAKIGPHNFAKMPEAAAKLYKFQELDEDTKAAIEAAKAAEETDTAAAPAPAAEGAAPEPTAEGAAPAPTAEGDWEARYKGASKKINELQAKIEADANKAKDALAAVNDELSKAVAAREEATKALKDFNDQIEKAGYKDLGELIGSVSGLKADLDKGAKDLADCREQLDHLKETRDLLTGRVLTPGDQLPTMNEGLAKCKTPKEKSAFLASGKYRKNK